MSTYEISKSSLLSLKAEILRKQEELQKAKIHNIHKQEQILKKSRPIELKNKGVERREQNDLTEEETNLLKLSRDALEAKSKLYDKLTKGAKCTDEENEVYKRFLVRFEKKNRHYGTPLNLDDPDDVDKYPESEEEATNHEDYESRNTDEDWVEYIDCLGRTRKCMRKDLEFLKSKDVALRSSIDDLGDNRSEQILDDEKQEEMNLKSQKPDIFDAKSEMLSLDMRRELLRQQWEKEEESLRDKSDIHYQDLLFNEARTHGVGYYGFSKDEDVRARQQKELKNLRESTALKQKKAQELRAMREKQLASRAKAARNRKRARMGLPPEEDEPEKVEPPKEPTPPPQIDEHELKENERKERARLKHVRPWDVGKEGLKRHYEHTQEEWVDKMRNERPGEFAPPQTYSRGFRSAAVPEREERTEAAKSLYFSTKKQRTRDDSEEKLERSKNLNPYKTREAMDAYEKRKFERVPIVNELDESGGEEEADLHVEERGKGVEIAPPPTFDHYGPSTSRARSEVNKDHLQESIAAGLQFLRQQAERKQSSSMRPDEMFLS